MKKVINVGIGGRSFTIDEDAFEALDKYLCKFRSRVNMGIDTKEVMNDLEDRIADIFAESLHEGSVVSIKLVNDVIERLGMPDDNEYKENNNFNNYNDMEEKATKRYYRNSDDKVIAGICSGFAAYFNLDVVLVRVIFVILLLCGSAGFWLYIILWLVAPLAVTAKQKCELRGLPVTFENIRRFSNK